MLSSDVDCMEMACFTNSFVETTLVVKLELFGRQILQILQESTSQSCNLPVLEIL